MTINFENRPRKQLRLAIPLVLLACFFTALMALVVKIGASHLTPESMVFWRSVIGLLILLPWIQFTPPHAPLSVKLKTKQWKIHLIRGIASFLSIFFYFYSLKYIDLTTSTLLYNTIPIFVPIVGYLWKRIVIYHRLWWALGIAFLGILCVLQPGKGVFQFASIIALLSGIMGAVSLVAMRFGHYSDPPSRILFYVFAVQGVCTGLVTLFTFGASWESLHLKDLFPLGLIGIFGFLYQISMTSAVKFASVRYLSPFLYVTVVFTMIFDKLIWDASLSWLSLLGFFLIVSGAILMMVLYPKEDLHFKPK